MGLKLLLLRYTAEFWLPWDGEGTELFGKRSVGILTEIPERNPGHHCIQINNRGTGKKAEDPGTGQNNGNPRKTIR